MRLGLTTDFWAAQPARSDCCPSRFPLLGHFADMQRCCAQPCHTWHTSLASCNSSQSAQNLGSCSTSVLSARHLHDSSLRGWECALSSTHELYDLLGHSYNKSMAESVAWCSAAYSALAFLPTEPEPCSDLQRSTEARLASPYHVPSVPWPVPLSSLLQIHLHSMLTALVTLTPAYVAGAFQLFLGASFFNCRQHRHQCLPPRSDFVSPS